MSARLSVRLALTAALLFGAAGVAAAQQPAAPPPPTPTAVAVAKEIVLLKGGNLVFERIVPGVVESAKAQLIQGNPNLSRELTDVANMLHKEYEPKRAEIVNSVCVLYAQRFTEQELKDLLAFYRTPLGKKAIVEEPTALDLSMKYADNWANDLFEKTMARYRDEMKKKGHTL